MNTVKNIMFMIIAIQLLVVAQLLSIRYWDFESDFNKIFNRLTWDIMNPSSKPLLLQEERIPKLILNQSTPPQPLTSEERAVVMTLISSAENGYKSFTKYFKKKGIFVEYGLTTDERKKLEYQAKKFLGIRYVWGATGPNKFDCSGFTQKVYKTAGIKLPRHSTRQAMVGQYIKYKDLQRGDMVFFDTSKEHKGVVNHVGIYLEDGKFIHASSGKKKVVITSFEKKKFYKNRFLWGRRIIKEKRVKAYSLNRKVINFLSFTVLKKGEKLPS